MSPLGLMEFFEVANCDLKDWSWRENLFAVCIYRKWHINALQRFKQPASYTSKHSNS